MQDREHIVRNKKTNKTRMSEMYQVQKEKHFFILSCMMIPNRTGMSFISQHRSEVNNVVLKIFLAHVA